MIGDGAAVKEADRGHHNVVVGIVRRSRRRQRRLRVGEADDRHHRDRWHPRFFVSAGIVRREQRAAILAAARRVASDLEKTAVRGQAGKIGVTGAARLAGLPGVARQRIRRRCVASCQNTGKQKRRSCGYQPAIPRGKGKTTRIPPYHRSIRFDRITLHGTRDYERVRISFTQRGQLPIKNKMPRCQPKSDGPLNFMGLVLLRNTKLCALSPARDAAAHHDCLFPL